MKRKLLSALLAFVLCSFAFASKAEIVTISPDYGVATITLFPTNNIDPSVTISSTGNVPNNTYYAIVQLSGSVIVNGSVTLTYTQNIWNPWTNQLEPQNYSVTAYPDTDYNSPTYGQCYFYSVIVDTIANNVFHISF